MHHGRRPEPGGWGKLMAMAGTGPALDAATGGGEDSFGIYFSYRDIIFESSAACEEMGTSAAMGDGPASGATSAPKNGARLHDSPSGNIDRRAFDGDSAQAA